MSMSGTAGRVRSRRRARDAEYGDRGASCGSVLGSGRVARGVLADEDGGREGPSVGPITGPNAGPGAGVGPGAGLSPAGGSTGFDGTDEAGAGSSMWLAGAC